MAHGTADSDETRLVAPKVTDDNIQPLRPGDRVDVIRKKEVVYSGLVETVHGSHGLFWLFTDRFERKLIDVNELVVLKRDPQR